MKCFTSKTLNKAIKKEFINITKIRKCIEYKMAV